MALFELTPSRNGSRFGKLSSNMFFTRNTAKPKRVKHIEGLNGALICNVNDDPSVIRSTSCLDLHRPNVPSFEPTIRRAEKLLPPMGFWNTYGVVQDTDRWRQELASLAMASGLGLEKEEQKSNHKPPTATVDQQHASRSGARYSARTGRFNEGTAKSRGRTGSKHATPYSDTLFNVPENEREMWMLQVLCQLLGTSNLEEVQSWLVSATHAEKEQARTMINSALRGLKESERTTSNESTEQSVDFDALTNFVAKQKTEEKQAAQKYLKETLIRPPTTLQSINEEQQTDENQNDSWPNSNTSTTYQSAFQNYSRRAISSFETTNPKIDEEIETIKLNENLRQRPQSTSLTKTPLKRPSSKHHVDSLQLIDDNQDHVENEQQTPPPKETFLPRIKGLDLIDNAKSRKIRELQNQLSRQEEEAKKQFNELQSKQSRLENALKLLVKQTKHRSPTQDDLEIPKGHSAENRPSKSFSGLWRPDTSTIHRLQGN